MPAVAVLVIDLQNDFLAHLDSERVEPLITNVNAFVDQARAAGAPIVWVRQIFKADLSDAPLEVRDRRIAVVVEGTPGAALHADLHRRPVDAVITKKRYSAFFGTDLDARLAAWGVDRVALAGVNTHACIRTTAIDAYERDLRVSIAADCVASHDPVHAQVSLDYMDGKIAHVRPAAEIAAALKPSAA